ncbi:hypothetical protein FHX42_000066 [Saccharopolyspora lacisalsi]|uniref:DUF3017 domain-containing protein n=1 Tax=Halosaccharopolyspora lacisalsi TaxID=1000566 RepID=A0A839DTL3_9PSEU|nr:DUF3017 domain-containing protein [Halosaccharopolyspora lacisalsi]MBA8822737.1 hypothetical protein [Halosaccharopolyspora lacisalsi]
MTDRFGGGSRLSVYLAFGLVGLVVLIGFLRVATQHWRDGSTLLGCALLLAAGLRATLSTKQAGLLAIRSRVVDIVLYGVLGLLIVAVALTIKGGPLDM